VFQRVGEYMTDEVYTDCPNCDAQIPFYKTVDELQRCPECGTDRDELFEIALRSPIEPATSPDPDTLLADGGGDE